MCAVAPPTAALQGEGFHQSGHECVLFPLGVEGKGLPCVHVRAVTPSQVSNGSKQTRRDFVGRVLTAYGLETWFSVWFKTYELIHLHAALKIRHSRHVATLSGKVAFRRPSASLSPLTRLTTEQLEPFINDVQLVRLCIDCAVCLSVVKACAVCAVCILTNGMTLG